MTRGRNKPNQQILDEAAEWFVDFREGDLADATAQRAFNQWLRRSPEHVAAYMEVAAFWADVPNIATKDEIDVPALVAYARGDDNVVPLAAGRTAGREVPMAADSAGGGKSAAAASFWGSWKRGVLAAGFAVAVSGLAWRHLEQRDTYRTDIGEQRSVLLEDGSTVELNARSHLRVRFSESARDIELLEGQALFRAAKDPVRPFVVRSGEATVRAVGTQFDVYRKRSGTTVTVVEGKVAVASPELVRSLTSSQRSRPSVSTLLSAGEQIVVGTKTASRPKPADIPAATAWTQRQIVFQGTPLGEVVEEFNRYNLSQMVIADETLQGVRVSGVFSSTEPASLLRFLREQVRLEVVEGEESIRISRQ
jgi:transmembrane sensor